VPSEAPPPPVLRSPPASARVTATDTDPLPSHHHLNDPSASSQPRDADEASVTALRGNGTGSVNGGGGSDGVGKSSGISSSSSLGIEATSSGPVTASTDAMPPPPESPNVVLSDYEELQKRLAANEEAMRSFSLGANSNKPNDVTTGAAASVVVPSANQSSLNGFNDGINKMNGVSMGTGDGRLERRAVEECLRGALTENRKELRRDIQNLHLDMLRQFEEQQQVLNQGSVLELLSVHVMHFEAFLLLTFD